MLLSFDFRLISKDNFKCANRQGRFFLSKEYKDFENKVKVYAFAQVGKPLLTGALKVHINAYFTNKVHADLFNLPKSLADSLQGILYINDRQIKIGSIEVFEGCPADRFTIEISELK